MTVENATSEAVSDAPAIDQTALATHTDETPNADAEKATDADKAARALQRRVDRLTREKYQLRAENEQLRAPRQSEGDPQTGDDVETRAQALAREMTEAKEFNDRCNDVFDKGIKASKQFAESLKVFAEEVGAPFDAKGKPSALMTAVLDADEPHKLIIYLANEPDKAAELAGLTPSRQIRRIAQLEKEMADAEKPQRSDAPKPAQPVRAAAGIDKEPDPKDTARWIKWENEKLIAARRK